MDPIVSDLLKKYSINAGNSQHNFKTSFGPVGNWYIPDEYLFQFWSEYCHRMYNAEQQTGKPLVTSLAQRAYPEVPFFIMATLKFENNNKEDIRCYYDETFIPSIVMIYQKCMSDLFNLNDEFQTKMCVLLENKIPYVERFDIVEYKCVSFVLWFPFFLSSPNNFSVLHEKAIKLIKSKNLLKKLIQQPVNDWKDIFNTTLTGYSFIPSYMSVKNPNAPVARFTTIFKELDQENIDSGDYDAVPLSNIFNPANHAYFRHKQFENLNQMAADPLELWLPLLFSTDFFDEISPLKPPDVQKPSIIDTLKIGDEKNMLDTLIRMVNLRERLTKPYFFLDIGKSIYRVYDGSPEGENYWYDIIPEDLELDIDISVYQEFNSGNHNTIKTVAWYAKEDSPEKYKEWHEAWIKTTMQKALSATDNDIAKCIYSILWTDLLFKNKSWYEYQNHRWKKRDYGIAKKITDIIVPRFEKLYEETDKKDYTKIRTVDDGQEQNYSAAEAKIMKDNNKKLIEKIVILLKSNRAKKRIADETIEFFAEEYFTYPFDENTELLGVSNGVIEICDKKAYFRSGKPEDYITYSTKTMYDVNMKKNHVLFIKLERWLTQVFVDRDLRDHFLKLSASKLRGRNMDKLLEVWTGSGNNSKSMMVKLFEMTFGDYCAKLPTEVLTSTPKGSGPNPELAQLKGTRVACLQETDTEVPMKTAVIKRLTGGDSMFARNCCDNGGKMELTFKTVLQCNQIPSPNSVDTAVVNRLTFLPFHSTWVKDPPATIEEQFKTRCFKMVNDFEIEIKDMCKAFLWWLVELYPRYAKEGIETPKSVIEFSDKYWKGADPFIRFFDEMVVKVMKGDQKDPNVSFSLSEFNTAFRSWFEGFYGRDTRTIPGVVTLEQRLLKHLDAGINKRWYGYQIKKPEPKVF